MIQKAEAVAFAVFASFIVSVLTLIFTSSYYDGCLKELQAEAVKRGVATYKPDSFNQPKFEWIERAGK